MLECLTSAVLLFQLEHQVVMHSILGGLHILACLIALVLVFAHIDSTLLIAVIGTLAFLTMIVSISTRLIDYIDVSSLLIVCTCAFIAATHVKVYEIDNDEEPMIQPKMEPPRLTIRWKIFFRCLTFLYAVHMLITFNLWVATRIPGLADHQV